MSTTPYSSVPAISRVIPFPSRGEAPAGIRLGGVCRFDVAIGAIERLMDFLAVVAGVWGSYWVHAAWRERGGAHISNDAVLTAAAGFAVVVVLLLEKYGDYQPCLSLLAVRETERLLRVACTGAWLGLPILVVLTRATPRGAAVLALVVVPLMLVLEKWQVQKAVRMLRRRLGITRKAVILGTGTLGRKAFSTLVRSPKLCIDPVAFVAADRAVGEPMIYESSYHRERQAQVLPGPVTPRLLRKLGADVLIIADPEMPPDEAISIRSQAEAAGIATFVIPEPFLDEGSTTEYVEMDGMLLAYKVGRSERRFYEAAKRGLDVALSAFALLALSPIFAVAASAVKLTSPGPVIFRQQRVGRHGRRFTMYKFRTMYVDSATYACSPVSGKDPRITTVGRWLRHACIDELPQLVNVLRGEMSLVGPRPEMPFIVDQYGAIHLKRLSVTPGLTGLWQLSADRLSPIHKNIGYDLYYVKHRSVLMDVAILLHTVVFACRGV